MLSLINALKEHGRHSITFAYLPAAYDALHVVLFFVAALITPGM
jgi:hypothetical protein